MSCRRASLTWLPLLIVLGLPGELPAQGASTAPIVLLADRDTRAYKQAAQGIADAGRPMQRRDPADPSTAALLLQPDDGRTWIAMGPRSARLLASATPRARAALLLRRNQVPEGLAAVTLQVPYARQLAWIRQAFPGRYRIVVLRKPGGSVDDAALRSAAKALDLGLVLADVSSGGDAVPALETALRERRGSTLLLLLPDPVAVSTDTVAPLIQTALAARAPVVGFSDYFLRVGALAAVALDYRACGRQALVLATEAEPRSAPPATARLLVDGRLAERLGITVEAGPGVEVRR